MFIFFLKGNHCLDWTESGFQSEHIQQLQTYSGERTQTEKQEDNALSNKRRSAIIHVLGRKDQVIVTETTRIFIFFTLEGTYPVCQGLSHTLTRFLMFLISIKSPSTTLSSAIVGPACHSGASLPPSPTLSGIIHLFPQKMLDYYCPIKVCKKSL